ncbi:hypothetical protein [Sphingomonas sp. HMP6]|uniref:hypothetical protein n=1 Tax=Sphingomonas sp. HMP6 TaxID=1517551 RepID=UPI0015970F11|nr:hypothetical protein [Sphingomonas sp. HMP6]BCA57686.1 hypothetical protein HMP06_0455 [Sphingomonas sp. HMP6]
MIGYEINDSAVIASLDARGARAHGELRASIGRLALKLSVMVKRDKLSGQVLGVKTGRLRRSVHDAVADVGDNIEGVVSTNVGYGIGWELGWPGGGSPKQSLNTAKAKFSPSSGGDSFKNGTPKKRSFLRTALKDLEGSGAIRAELNEAAARIAR